MNKKVLLWGVTSRTLLLVFFILLSVNVLASSHSVRVLENTDQCLTDCFTVYEVCALTNDVSLRFEFDRQRVDLKTRSFQGFKETNIKDFDYRLSDNFVKKGDCERIKISGKKMPDENIDNIPVIDGVKHPEFIWWNSSWEHRILLSESGSINKDNTIARLQIDDITGLECNNTSLHDLRVTWENSSYAEERPLFKYINSADQSVIYLNATNKTGGHYYAYCNNSIVSDNEDANKVFYFYDNAADNVGVNYSKWDFDSSSNSCGGTCTMTFTDAGSYYFLRARQVNPHHAGNYITWSRIQMNSTNYAGLGNNTISVWNILSETRDGTVDWQAINYIGMVKESAFNTREMQHFCQGGGVGACSYSARNYLSSDFWNTKNLEGLSQLREVTNWQDTSGNNITKYYLNTSLESTNTSQNRPDNRELYARAYARNPLGWSATAESRIMFYWAALGEYSGLELSLPESWNVTASHSSGVLEGSSQDYYLILQRELTTNSTWNQSINGSASVFFSVDNSSVNASLINATINNITFKVTKTLPAISGDSLIQNITWNYTLNTPVKSGSDVSTQTIYKPSLNNCSSGIETINFSILDEDTKASLSANTTMSYSWTLNGINYNSILNYDNNASPRLCIYPSFANITDINYLWHFESNGYETREITGVIDLSNQTINQNLYLSSSTNLVTVTLVDQNYNGLEGYFIEIEKKDLATGTYILIHSGTTDFDGSVYANLDTSVGQKYRFRVKDGDGNVLQTQGPYEIPSSYQVTIVLQSGSVTLTGYFILKNNIDVSLSYDNVTRVVSMTYSDPNNTSANSCLRIRVVSESSESLYSLNCSLASSDTFTSTLVNGSLYYASAIFQSSDDGAVYKLEEIEIDLRTTGLSVDAESVFTGLEALFWGFILTALLVLLGIKIHPAISIILLSFGLIVLTSVGLFNVAWPAIIGIILSGLILVVKFR